MPVSRREGIPAPLDEKSGSSREPHLCRCALNTRPPGSPHDTPTLCSLERDGPSAPEAFGMLVCRRRFNLRTRFGTDSGDQVRQKPAIFQPPVTVTAVALSV